MVKYYEYVLIRIIDITNLRKIMKNKKTLCLCKYCKNSKIIEKCHSYTYWLEYDCQYKSKEYEYVPVKVECDNYLKMNILEKLIRSIRVFMFCKFDIVLLLIMSFIIMNFIIMSFITKNF